MGLRYINNVSPPPLPTPPVRDGSQRDTSFKNFHFGDTSVGDIAPNRIMVKVYIANNFRLIIFPKKVETSLTPKYQLNICKTELQHSVRNFNILQRGAVLQMQPFSCQHREQYISNLNDKILVVILWRRFIFPDYNYKDGSLIFVGSGKWRLDICIFPTMKSLTNF